MYDQANLREWLKATTISPEFSLAISKVGFLIGSQSRLCQTQIIHLALEMRRPFSTHVGRITTRSADKKSIHIAPSQA
jgi:hypothetical protein